MPDYSSETGKTVGYLVRSSRARDGSVANEALRQGGQYVKTTRMWTFSHVINLCGDRSLSLHVDDARHAQKGKVEVEVRLVRSAVCNAGLQILVRLVGPRRYMTSSTEDLHETINE